MFEGPLYKETKTNFNNSFVDLKNYDLNKEQDRLRTFEDNYFNISNVSFKELAIVGYYFLQNPDVVKCQFCHLVLTVSHTQDSVLCRHLRVSPNCPLLIRLPTRNQPISEDELQRLLPPASYDVCGNGDMEFYSQSSEIPASSRRHSRRLSRSEFEVRFFEYRLPCDRLKSFTSWPRGIKQRPPELVEAGFFYSGKGDEIVCFSCGLGICQLEPDDNPWVEHHNLLINRCSYLELNNEILKTNQIIYQEKMASKESQIIELELCKQLENETINNSIETKCKICLNHKANIVFLPCKHVAVCSQCVFGINEKCPICRGIIEQKLPLFYS